MAEPVQEKRVTRRFALRLPLEVTFNTNGNASASDPQRKIARTRDVSARGVCFYLDSGIGPQSFIEFTLELPAEVTLAESIRVHCKGRVVRVEDQDAGGKIAIAAVIDDYEFHSQAATDDAKP